MRKKKAPEKINVIVGKVLKKLSKKQEEYNFDREIMEVLKGMWGKRKTGHIRVGFLKKGRLELIVSHPSLIQELTGKKKEIMERVNERSPRWKVKNILFRVRSF